VKYTLGREVLGLAELFLRCVDEVRSKERSKSCSAMLAERELSISLDHHIRAVELARDALKSDDHPDDELSDDMMADVGVLHPLVKVGMLCHLVGRGVVTVDGDGIDTR
jgi:hypothetical protein